MGWSIDWLIFICYTKGVIKLDWELFDQNIERLMERRLAMKIERIYAEMHIANDFLEEAVEDFRFYSQVTYYCNHSVKYKKAVEKMKEAHLRAAGWYIELDRLHKELHQLERGAI